MEITDVTTIDQLSDAEVDELLARALDPQTPIEIFYAVLSRIGGTQHAPTREPAPPAAADEPEPVEAGTEA